MIAMAVLTTMFLSGGDMESEVVTHTLPFELGQQLKIDQKVGNILIKSGKASGITVVATKKTKGSMVDLKKMKVVVETKPEGVYIMTDWQQNKNLLDLLVNDQGSNSVDLVIDLPKEAEIEINSGVGNIDIEDVEGDIDVGLGVGNIILKYPTGAEKSDCHLRTGVGDINLLYLAAGTKKSICHLETDVGNIKVDFAAGVSAHIDATCGVGEIISKISRLSPSSDYGAGDSGVFQIGTVDGNSFELKTGVGNISLKTLKESDSNDR
jgi:hypothetical protein